MKPAKVVQFLFTLAPSWGIERPQAAMLVQLHAGFYLRPEEDPLGIAFDGREDLPQPRRVLLASRQDRPAIGAEGYGIDRLWMLQGRGRSWDGSETAWALD